MWQDLLHALHMHYTFLTLPRNGHNEGLTKEDAERCKRFLWDDDENVRQLMANKLSALWQIGDKVSVANALVRIYTLFPTPFLGKADIKRDVDAEECRKEKCCLRRSPGMHFGTRAGSG